VLTRLRSSWREDGADHGRRTALATTADGAPHAATTSAPWYATTRAAAGYDTTAVAAPHASRDTVHGGVSARAAEAPDAPAVLALPPGGGPAVCALTRRQLQAASGKLAARLQRCCHQSCHSADALTIVAVLLDSTPARLVAYLAVLRAGCVFAPLEAAQPRDALAAALAAAAPVALITSADLAPPGELPGVTVLLLDDATGALLPGDADEDADEACSDDWDDGALCAATLAHACFTSGTSTGVPRLLACAHGGSLASHAWRTALCPYSPDDVTAANVFGIWDAAAALLAGTAVAPLRDALVRGGGGGGGALGGALLRCGATRVMLTPTLAAALLRDPLGAAALRALRLLTLCGEPAGAPLLAALRQAMRPEAVLLNLYSLSEAHDVAAERITSGGGDGDAGADADGAPVGVTCGFVAPFACVHVLRPDGSVATAGERGAVWLSGTALAAGHVTQSGCVDAYAPGGGFADVMLPADDSDDAAHGADRTANVDGCSATTRVRAFHTGDVGTLLRDGRLVVDGRAAGAAKLKLAGGATADAGAIEAAILRCCGARVAAAAVAERRGELAAFLVASAAHDDDGGEDAGGQAAWRSARWVRDALAGALPAHALPQRIVWMPALPLGATGKLDRAALPWPAEVHHAEQEQQREADAVGDADDDVRARTMFAAAVRISVADCSATPDTHFVLDLGGTSVAAAAMLGGANAATCARGCPPLRLMEFIADPTLGGLARMLRRQRLRSAEDAYAAAADAAEAKAVMHDADTLPVAGDTADADATTAPAAAVAVVHGACIVLTGAAGTIGVHVLCALFSHLESRSRDDATAGCITLVCLIRAADDAAADARLRAALARHDLPPLPPPCAGMNVAVAALSSDLQAPYLGLAGGAATYASLAAATRAVLHAAGRVSLAAPYASLRGPNVLASAAVMRFVATAAAPLHIVSSAAALPYDGAAVGDAAQPQRAAPPPARPPAGGYSRAKWAVERLAMRAAAAAPDGGSGADITLHRVGYIACRAGVPGAAALPPDAQGIVLAACAALCAAPERRGWALSWADLPRFAAALAVEVASAACATPQMQRQLAAAALPQQQRTLHVVHHAGADVSFEAALLRLRARGLPAFRIDAAAWEGAVRAGAGADEDDVSLAFQHAAALLDAVGLDAACGAADVQLLRSRWPHEDAAHAHEESELMEEEGIALLDGVLDALAAQGMLPAAGACVHSSSP
jgi:thioester reductase-like protein/acyl-CoA synthetase (AMP-forming)/AMP-acid ligase II